MKLLVGLLFNLITCLQTQSTPDSNQTCCLKKVITAPAQYLGTYNFIRTFDGEKDENCYDGCIYSKEGSPNEEYCFKAVTSDGATINDQCEAPTSPSTGTLNKINKYQNISCLI